MSFSRDQQPSYEDLLTMLRRDLQLDGATDIQPNSVGPSALAEVPYAVLSFAASISIPNAAATTVIWDNPTPINLRGGMGYNHSTGYVTVPQSGLYLVAASASYTLAASGVGNLGPVINGTDSNLDRPTLTLTGVGGFLASMAFCFPFVAQAGTTFGIWTEQNSGAALNLVGSVSVPNQFSVAFLSNYA